MSESDHLGTDGTRGDGRRSFRRSLTGRQQQQLNKELDDLAKKTVTEVKLKKQLEIASIQKEVGGLHKRVKEEFSSPWQPPPRKNPSFIPEDLRPAPERIPGSRERARLHPYNPLNNKTKKLSGPLNKYPFKNQQTIPLEAMKNNTKMTSVGVIPIRKSTEIESLRVLLTGTNAIPIDDRSIQEIETANIAVVVDDVIVPARPKSRLDDMGVVSPRPTPKPAILSELGTARLATCTERPRPSSRLSQLSSRQARNASGAGSKAFDHKLTASRLNVHDYLTRLDVVRLPEYPDYSSEHSGSTIKSAKELLDEATAIVQFDSKPRKSIIKTKKRKDSVTKTTSRGRTVDEIIASLRNQQNDLEELSESDKKIQAIMKRVLQRTQAVLGGTTENTTSKEDDEMKQDGVESPAAVPVSEWIESIQNQVDIIEPGEVDSVCDRPVTVSDTVASAVVDTDESLSRKMADVEAALAAIHSEIDVQKTVQPGENPSTTERAPDESKEFTIAQDWIDLMKPLEVTNEELVSIQGTRQTLQERAEYSIPADKSYKPPVRTNAVSFLSSWAPKPVWSGSERETKVRDRDEKSVHHFCSVTNEYQLPYPFRGVIWRFHAPDKYAHAEFGLQHKVTFGSQMENKSPTSQGARTTSPEPCTTSSGPGTMSPEQGTTSPDPGTTSPPSDTKSHSIASQRLNLAVERIMEEVLRMQPNETDLAEWKKKSYLALSQLELKVHGEKMAMQQDESKFYWTPAPPKLDLAPRYVKQRLFPRYRGTLNFEDHPKMAVDEIDMSGDEEGGPEEDVDTMDLVRRNRLINRRCKSPQDMSTYARAKRERQNVSSTISSRLATPRGDVTPSVTQNEASPFAGRSKYPQGLTPIPPQGKKETESDPTKIPTFVRRRTKSSPGKVGAGASLQIPENFQTAMEELQKQQQNLKLIWQTSAETVNTKLELADTFPTGGVPGNAVKVSESERINYDLGVGERIYLRDQRKTPAELALEAGRSYVLLPKKKKRKQKPVNLVRLHDINEFMQRKPRTLERSDSYREFNVPLPDRELRVPENLRGVNYRGSLPDLLNFDQYAQKRDAPSGAEACREWARDIWNTWFDDVFPPETESDDDVDNSAAAAVQSQSLAPTKAQEDDDDDDEDGNKKVFVEVIVELSDDLPPVFEEDEADRDVIMKLLNEEVEHLTRRIDTDKPNAFDLCRRGAIYKKLGKLKSAMEDFNRCLSMEPMLLDAYWHRHLLRLVEQKLKAALEDLNFLIKHNTQHAKAYKSRAEIYRQRGDLSLAIMNYSAAIKLNPADDESYFRRAEMYEARGDVLLALEDYSITTRLKPQRTDALYKRALYHFRNKNWQPAITGFTDILRQEPTNAKALTLRGQAFAAQGQFTPAVRDYSAAVHLEPNNHVAFYHRACLVRKCHPQRALRDFSLSLLLDDSEDNILAYLHRGILYYELGRLDDAMADFKAVTLINRDNACAHCNLGLIYFYTGSYHRAIKKFSTAALVEPTYLRAYLCRAETYVKLHDLKNALCDLTRAIYLHPDIPHHYMHRGYLLLQMGRLDLAAYCIRNAAGMSFDSNINQSATQQAVVQAFLKNYDEVIRILELACKQQPTVAMHVLLGKMLMKAKLNVKAVEVFDEALETMKPSKPWIPWPKEAAEIHYLKAMCYSDLGTYASAQEALNQAIASNGKMADAYYQRGYVRIKLRQMKGIQDFNRALAIDPKHFAAFLGRAAYYAIKRQYSKAVLNCNEALRLQPDSVRAYLYRGSLKYHLRTYDLAVKDLNTAILIDNDCHLAYFNRAICYQDSKQYNKALIDYGIALLIGNSLKVQVLINRGLVYYQLKDYGNALQDFLAASDLLPRDHKLMHTLGLCYHRLRRLEEAVKSFTLALDLEPLFLDAFIGRGNAYMDFGTNLGLMYSRRDYEHCMMMDPGYLPARVNLAYNLQMCGKFMQAWKQFTAALSIKPDYVPALEGRAVISLQMSNTFGAIQDIKAALKATPSAELYTNLGVIHQFMGDKVNAMRSYQKALVLDGTFSLAYFNAANMYFHNRQFTQAKDYYDKALLYNAEDESAYLNRAITKVMLRDPSGALDDFRRAVELSPRAAHVYFNRANLYSSLKQYSQAELDYTKVLELLPGDMAVYRCRADVRGKLGDKVGAVADYMVTVDAAICT